MTRSFHHRVAPRWSPWVIAGLAFWSVGPIPLGGTGSICGDEWRLSSKSISARSQTGTPTNSIRSSVYQRPHRLPQTDASFASASRAEDQPTADPLEFDSFQIAPLGRDPLTSDPLADPLRLIGPAPHSIKSPEEQSPEERADASNTKRPDPNKPDPHESLWIEGCYPSAETCQKCHPKHYDEWRASSHAYAAVSPMFQRFEQAMSELTKGTVGSFCVRCHMPVGTQINYPRHASILDAPPVVREGVTCVACHRVNEFYGRSHGDRRIEPGDIHAPVGRGGDGQGLAAALAQPAKYKLKTQANQKGPGQAIHNGSYFYPALSTSDVCVSCHQVAVHPGIWLEVVHAQYRSGPAAKRGVSCQDCHMGAIPGKESDYEICHVAELGGKPYGQPKKHANHTFWGPGFSIAHPGIFPFNPDAKTYTPRQWLQFDERAGWGTKSFEQNVAPETAFPPPWDNVDDRMDARKIIDANLKKMHEKRGFSAATLAAAGQISAPIFYTHPMVGSALRIGYRVDNISDGHNLPTGSLGAQPQMWLNAVLINPNGDRVWETGYLDSNADLADMHSIDVAKGRIPRDKGLFNLQTKFLISNVRGTDREVALPLNYSLDPLPLLRPGAVPVSVLNHPPLIRMEAHSIPPLDHRIAKYTIPASALTVPGPYRLSVRMRSRTEPMYFMRLINCTPDMIRRMNERMIDFAHGSHTFWVR
ncbi:MAG: multiheme c-type cytochrome [Planctomycetota bacterium]